MIDLGTRSALAICDVCGLRELTNRLDQARRWLALHEAATHPGTYNARRADLMARRRAEASDRETLAGG